MWPSPMFERQGPDWGPAVVLVAAVLWLTGFLWVRRILDLRTERSAFRATARPGLLHWLHLAAMGVVVAGTVVLALLGAYQAARSLLG